MAAPERYKPEVPYGHTPRSFSRFHYLDKERPELLTTESLSYDLVGAWLETYVNALHVPLLLEESKFTDTIVQPDAYKKIRDVEHIQPAHAKPRSYIADTIGDYRAANSFFRRDKGSIPNYPLRQKSQPHISTQFAQDVHKQIRMASVKFGTALQMSPFPPAGYKGGGKEDRKKAQAALDTFATYIDPKQYAAIYTAFRNEKDATPTDRDKARIFMEFLGSDELAEYDDAFAPVVRKVKEALSPPQLTSIFVTYAGNTVEIDNTQRMNEQFGASYPALILLALQTVGVHMIDRTYIPQQAFDFFTDIVGVESQISENVQPLSRLVANALRDAGHAPNDDVLYPMKLRTEFVAMVRQHQREIQFLYTFNKAAGQLHKIYPPEYPDLAFRDMEAMLKMAGVVSPQLEAIQTPGEMACLLFAIDRNLRLARPYTLKKFEELGGQLLQIAENIGHCKTLDRIPPDKKTQAKELLTSVEMAIDNQMSRKPISLDDDVKYVIALIRNALDRQHTVNTPGHSAREQQRNTGQSEQGKVF